MVQLLWRIVINIYIHLLYNLPYYSWYSPKENEKSIHKENYTKMFIVVPPKLEIIHSSIHRRRNCDLSAHSLENFSALTKSTLLIHAATCTVLMDLKCLCMIPFIWHFRTGKTKVQWHETKSDGLRVGERSVRALSKKTEMFYTLF